jgi:ABC-2 type transport system ATP-binding protein
MEDKKIIIQAPINTITEKLVFRQVMDLHEIPAPIYSEGGLKGHAVIAHNHTLAPSRLDMEIFFNAVLTEKDQILPLFNL